MKLVTEMKKKKTKTKGLKKQKHQLIEEIRNKNNWKLEEKKAFYEKRFSEIFPLY